MPRIITHKFIILCTQNLKQTHEVRLHNNQFCNLTSLVLRMQTLLLQTMEEKHQPQLVLYGIAQKTSFHARRINFCLPGRKFKIYKI